MPRSGRGFHPRSLPRPLLMTKPALGLRGTEASLWAPVGWAWPAGTKLCRKAAGRCGLSMENLWAAPVICFHKFDSYGSISMVAQMVKCLPTMWKTWVRSLGREDPLEKEMATTPVLLPGKSHGWRSLVGYSPRGHKESDTTERLHSLTHLLI